MMTPNTNTNVVVETSDLEMCGVIASSEATWSNIGGVETCHFLVSRDSYEADLRSCLRSDRDAWKQVLLDVPRCEFTMDGDPAGANALRHCNRRLWRFCTQGVLGMPVMALHHALGVIAEPQCISPMQIDVWAGTHVLVTKQLRVLRGMDCPVEDNRVLIHVRVNLNDAWADVEFVFDQSASPAQS